MQQEIVLDIPNEIIGKLFTGEYERVGSVIRNSKNKNVVLWLRESSPFPLPPTTFPRNPIEDMFQIRGLSMLNLGATVAFGVATLNKLNKIDNKINLINQKIDIIISKIEELNQRMNKLQWTVEFGIANILQSLDNMKQFQEIQLAGELNSAASMAWSCQFLEPGSAQRIARIENAFHSASNVKEKILLHAEHEMSQASEMMIEKRKESFDFSIDDRVITSLYRLRQAIAACVLSASINAESGDLFTASAGLGKDYARLSAPFQLLGESSINSDAKVYLQLFDKSFMEIMPASRIDMWSKQFDKKTNGIYGVLDLVRSLQKDVSQNNIDVSSSLTDEQIQVFQAIGMANNLRNYFYGTKSREIVQNDAKYNVLNNNTLLFFDLMDGISEDLHRLKGYESEYACANQLGMTIQEYRDNLCLEDVPDFASIVYVQLN